MGLSPSLGFFHSSVHVFPSTLMFVILGASGGPVKNSKITQPEENNVICSLFKVYSPCDCLSISHSVFI